MRGDKNSARAPRDEVVLGTGGLFIGARRAVQGFLYSEGGVAPAILGR